MPVLFHCVDPKAWVDAWESYRSVVQTLSVGKVSPAYIQCVPLRQRLHRPAIGIAPVRTTVIVQKTELQELDRWINEELPAVVAARPTPHIKQEELSKYVVVLLARFLVQLAIGAILKRLLCLVVCPIALWGRGCVLR
jgi:hypothetical protein